MQRGSLIGLGEIGFRCEEAHQIDSDKRGNDGKILFQSFIHVFVFGKFGAIKQRRKTDPFVTLFFKIISN